MKQTSNSDFSELPEQMRLPVKICESEFQQLFQASPLLSLHARFAFETLGKIGEGGMGSVYQVRDRRFDRVAALKLLKDTSATEQARLRFLREAQITAKLDHPAIPPVHEIGLTADGDLYMLMRMIRGKTLRQVIKECHEQGSMERRELIEIMIKVAEAVAYAHSQGILHRDLKPDNIMVGEFGEVLVIDWGIAKDLKVVESTQTDKILECVLSKSELEQVGVTVSGTMVGTPGYMAPEQIDGVNIDERADVFSLGLILVEVLTGKRAISGDTTIELVAATASGQATAPRDLDSSLSKEIDWIAREALELELEDRTQKLEDLVLRLRAYLNGAEVPGYSYSLLERTQRAIKRRPGMIVSTAVGALLFALIGNLWLTLELEGQRRQKAEEDVVVAKTKLGVAEDEAERAKAVLNLFNDARNLVERGAPQQKLKEKIDEALKRGGRTKNQLLTAARIYSDANFDALNRELLEEAVRLYSPCYEALFALHILELKLSNREFYFTSYLTKLLSESKERGDENEYTLFADAYQLELLGRLDQSIVTYSKIEKYSISFSWMYVNRGVIWKRKGAFDKALADYDRALEINPGYATVYTNRGLLWEVKGELDKALADYNKAIELDPRNAVTFGNRGIVWQKKGEPDKALSDYNKAIELDPRIAATFGNRGTSWENRGELGKALADYNKAIEIDAQYAAAFTNRGSLLNRMGDIDKALADYNRAIEINPQSAFAFNNRGAIWQKRGQFDKALADYNKAIEINPRYAIAVQNRGVLFERKGALDKALADFNRLIELEPQSAAVFFGRGVFLAKIDQYDKAILDLTKAIELKHRDPYTYFYRGYLYGLLNEAEDAVKDFEAFLRLAPNHPKAGEARANLARVRAARVK